MTNAMRAEKMPDKQRLVFQNVAVDWGGKVLLRSELGVEGLKVEVAQESLDL